MGILIKGMEMPKDGCHHMICIYADGTVSTGGRVYMAVSVPPHGRLIDADVLLASFKESIDECHKWANEIPNETEMYARVSQSLGTFVECSLRTKGMPTVIPADKDGEI